MVDIERTKKIKNPYKKRGYYYAFNCAKCNIQISSPKTKLKTHTGLCRTCNLQKRPFEALLTILKYNAAIKSREVTLTYEEFLTFTKINACHYCNQPVVWTKHLVKNIKQPTAYNLDRIDTSKGYTVDNCVVCCFECNWFKGDKFSYTEFLLLGKVLRQIKEQRDVEHERICEHNHGTKIPLEGKRGKNLGRHSKTSR